MRNLLIYLFLFLSSSAIAQFGKLEITSPPVVIQNGSDYATLTKKYKSGGYQWRFYESSSLGVLKFPRWRLAGFDALDSTYAVSNLPANWDIIATPCLFADKQALAVWSVTGDTLVSRVFNNQVVLTQKIQHSPDAFVLRGKNMLFYTNVSLISAVDSACYANIALGETGTGGLEIPSGFSTPSGYELITSSDGTPVYIIIGGELDDGGGGSTDPSPESYVFSPQKDVAYNTSGGIAYTKADWSITESGGRKYLQDANWSTGFDTGVTRRAFFGAEEYAPAAARNLSNFDVTTLEGFDIAPLILYEGQKYTQSFIHVKASATKNRRILTQGNKTYYWMPPSHNFVGGVLPTYYKDFPDFTPPAGKIVTSLNRYVDDYPNYYSNNKGLTNSPTKAFSSSHLYDYDQWARDMGFPAAYTASAATLNSILDNVNQTAFRNKFISDVVSVHGGRGILTLNFEAFQTGSGGSMNFDHPAMFAALSAWHDLNADGLLAFWAGGQGGVRVNRILMESQTTTSGMTPDLLYSGSYGDWLTNRAPSSVFQGSYGLFSIIPDIFYVNDGYQSKPDNVGWLHHALMMTIMNRKFFPSKKLLFQDFHKIEYQLTGEVDRVEIKNESTGEIYKIKAKPLVSPGQMFTRAAFAVAYADGIELWESPQTKMDDPYYYGNVYDDILDKNNSPLPTRVASLPDGNSGKYVDDARPMKGIDWSMAGVWAVSQNKDIVEAATSWAFNEFSVDNGTSWVTGNSTLPSETYVNKQPISIFKKSTAGDEGLLVFFNPFQDPTTEQNYLVRIDGNTYEVFQIGDYASVVRLDLDGPTSGGGGTGDDTGEPAADNFVANETIAKVGYIYGSNDINYDGYKNMRNQLSGGVAKFNFFGNPSPNNNFPALQDSRNDPNGNIDCVTPDYVVVDFPSHSYNYNADAAGKTGKIHYKIYDASDNLILEVYDTRGGQPGGLRSNNHPDNCVRWLKRGTYRIWAKNISTDGAVIKFQVGSTAAPQKYFDRSLSAGEIWEATIDLQQPEPNEAHRYKINCNTGYIN